MFGGFATRGIDSNPSFGRHAALMFVEQVNRAEDQCPEQESEGEGSLDCSPDKKRDEES